MANPADISDIESRWRPLSAQEAVNATAFLSDAWAMLLGRRPSLDADITAGTVSTDNVTRVVCAMVLRVMKNPNGFASETIDDWSGTRDALIASGELRITSDELADVTPGRRGQRSTRLVAYGDV